VKGARVWIAAAAVAALLGAGSSLAALDAGTAAASSPDGGRKAPTIEDRELSDNLDLLQELDAAEDLDLLLELSKKE
jgi:hypothetical protein